MLLQLLICIINTELLKTAEIMIRYFLERVQRIVDTWLNYSKAYLFDLKLSKP
jgi:hypothetical protein